MTIMEIQSPYDRYVHTQYFTRSVLSAFATLLAHFHLKYINDYITLVTTYIYNIYM